MEKRKLTEDELEKTNNGMIRLEKELIELKKTIDYNNTTIAFQKQQDQYQDSIRSYVREKRDKETQKAANYYDQDLKSKQDSIDTLKDHIENGVEIKKG